MSRSHLKQFRCLLFTNFFSCQPVGLRPALERIRKLIYMHALKALWPGSTIKRWLGSQPAEAKPAATPTTVPAKPQAPAARVVKTPPPMPVQYEQPAENVAAAKDTSLLRLPLKPIFDRLSPALQALANAEQITDTDEIALQVDNILTQLPGGVVRISFGELRHAAPAGIFADQNSHDYTLVDLPLSEVLERINPALLSLRSDRKRIAVPEDVTGVFGKNGTGTAVIAPPEPHTPAVRKTTTAAKPQAPAAAPAAPARSRVTLPPPPPGGDIIQFKRPEPNAAPAAEIPAPAPAPTPAAAPPRVAPSSIAMPPKVASRMAPAAPAAPVAPAQAVPSAAIPMPTGPRLTPMAAAAPAAPVAVVAVVSEAPAKAEPPAEPLNVPLANLTTNWPDAIKAEVEQARPAGVSLAIPLARLEGPMKTGKLNFRWSELRQWIKPVPLLGATPNGETEIQLALNVIAPIFFAHPARNTVAKKKAEIAHDIPDVFGSTSAANAVRELASVPLAKVTPPAAPAVEMPVAPAVAAQGSGATNLQVRNAQPANVNGNATSNGSGNGAAQAALFAKMDWTPENTVKITTATPGVAGAMITADDGLMIAAQLPATFKSDLLSAFVPQIFGRALQSAGELQLPALSSVRLTFGSQQCEIFKTGKLYYVIVGKAGEELPTPFLRKIAAELTKRN